MRVAKGDETTKRFPSRIAQSLRGEEKGGTVSLCAKKTNFHSFVPPMKSVMFFFFSTIFAKKDRWFIGEEIAPKFHV